MAIRRDNQKDYIFITNEYFENYKISKQVLQYKVERGEINKFGEVKGVSLYSQIEADLLIINYWSENFKKLVEIGSDINQFREFYDLLSKYLEAIDGRLESLSDFPKPIDLKDPVCKEVYDKVNQGIFRKYHRFELSNLSFEDFLKEDSMNKFRGKNHDEIVIEYVIKSNFRAQNINKIKKYISDYEKRYEKSKEEYDKKLYEKAKHYFVKLQKRRKNEK